MPKVLVRIALDCSIHKKIRNVLESLGCEVMQSIAGEPDEDFFDRSWSFDAAIYVSSDRDWHYFSLGRMRTFIYVAGMTRDEMLGEILDYLVRAKLIAADAEFPCGLYERLLSVYYGK